MWKKFNLEKPPFMGKRVVVTRSREQNSETITMIKALGGEAIEFPTIRIVEPRDFEPLDKALDNLEEYDWVFFTSVNGVKAFCNRLRYRGENIRELKKTKVGAIGPKTREALEGNGFLVIFTPQEYRAEAMLESLRGEIKRGDKVLLPRADLARKVLPEALKAMGAEVDDVEAYRTVTADDVDLDLFLKILKHKKAHVITFSSSSTVRNFFSLLSGFKILSLLRQVTIACIGPITSQTARDHGLKVDVEAVEYTMSGLLRALANYYSNTDMIE